MIKRYVSRSGWKSRIRNAKISVRHLDHQQIAAIRRWPSSNIAGSGDGEANMRVLGGALRTQNGRTLMARRKAVSRARVSDSKRRAKSSRAKLWALWCPPWGLTHAEGLFVHCVRCENTNYEICVPTHSERWLALRKLAFGTAPDRSLARLLAVTVYDRNAEDATAILGLASLFLLPSASSFLIFSYRFLPFFFSSFVPHRFIIPTLNDVFTINKWCAIYF